MFVVGAAGVAAVGFVVDVEFVVVGVVVGLAVVVGVGFVADLVAVAPVGDPADAAAAVVVVAAAVVAAVFAAWVPCRYLCQAVACEFFYA